MNNKEVMRISESDQQITQTGSIYIIRNTVNDKVYIGQTTMTVHERFLSHLKPSVHKTRGTYKLYNAMIKYGKDKFYYETLEENVPVEELDKKEIGYIKEYDSFNNGYNSTPGGNVRRIHEKYDIQNIVDLFSKGYCAEEIGDIYGVHKQTILRTLHGCGYTVRDSIDEDLLKLLFWKGFSNEQIAYLMNSKEWTIQRYLHKCKLSRRALSYIIKMKNINVEKFYDDYNNGLSKRKLKVKYNICQKTCNKLLVYCNEQLKKCNDYGVKSSTSEDELPMEVQSNSNNRVEEIVCANRNIGINVYFLPAWCSFGKR